MCFVFSKPTVQAWAYTALEHTSPVVFGSIAREIQEQLGEFNELELVLVARAFAKTGAGAMTLVDVSLITTSLLL